MNDGDVGVIGGGIVGLACALHLQRRGHRIVVIDPGDARRGASYGNAGVIGRGSILPVAGPGLWRQLPAYLRNADPGLHLRYRSLPGSAPWLRALLRHANEAAWRKAAVALDPLTASAFEAHRDLADEARAAGLIARRGYLKLYRTLEVFEASALEREILSHHGIRAEQLDGEEVARAEPALTRRFARGLLFPESGSVERPGELVSRYREAFLGRGGRLLDAACVSIEPYDEGMALRLAGGVLRVRRAVLAAGAWSHGLLRPLGYRFPMAAERGYHRHYRVGQPPTRPVHDTGGAYVLAPMGDGTVRLLSGIEIARPDDPPNSRQLGLVLPEARGTLALGAPVEAEPWCGSRPSTPDGLPIIGPAPRHPALILAFGHGHIGLSTGPVTGRIVADLLEERPPPIPVEAFSPARFAR